MGLWILRDSLGRCFEAFCCNLGSCSVIKAELRDILAGLQLAWSSGYHKILVQSDSQAAISHLSMEGDPLHVHAGEVLGIHELLKEEWEVSFTHISHEGN
ncbi:Putative ribonuclease H protein At1g65750 [Linum perenne]